MHAKHKFPRLPVGNTPVVNVESKLVLPTAPSPTITAIVMLGISLKIKLTVNKASI